MAKPALMLLVSGQQVNPMTLAQNPDAITIEDIAHALACVNRFGGHTRKPTNVAQHSVYVSRLCAPDPVARLQGLLHDASEAYLGDIIKWIKATPEFDAYRRIEDDLQRAIYRKFGVPEEMLPAVERADRIMVRHEGAEGYGAQVWSDWAQHFPHYPVVTPEERREIGPWRHWSWRWSRDVYLVEFRMAADAVGRAPGAP